MTATTLQNSASSISNSGTDEMEQMGGAMSEYGASASKSSSTVTLTPPRQKNTQVKHNETIIQLNWNVG